MAKIAFNRWENRKNGKKKKVKIEIEEKRFKTTRMFLFTKVLFAKFFI